MPAREVADGAAGRLVDARGQELLELLTPIVEDADRRILGSGELTGDFQDPIEDQLQVELGDEGAPDIQQSPQPCSVEMCIRVAGQTELTVPRLREPV